jgi:DNA primase
MGVKWDPQEERYALPIWRPDGVIRGRVLRLPPGDARVAYMPKALTWMYEDGPTLAWNMFPGDEVVVVEDIPSAMMLHWHAQPAVALNGTHLTDEALAELIQQATSVAWALDRDALGKAVNLCTKTRLYFRSSEVVVLERDIKDMPTGEVERCLSGISWGQY